MKKKWIYDKDNFTYRCKICDCTLMKKRDLIYHCSLHSKWTKRGYTPKDVFPYSSLEIFNFGIKPQYFYYPMPSYYANINYKPIFIAYLFTPKGIMISQYSQFLFNQMFEPYSEKGIQEIMNKIKIENKNENQQNHSKEPEKKPFVHLISQSTYNQLFRLKSKLNWNKFNDDIYFNEGL